jgi:tetratricopeptide (TPR) repeat protein
MPKIRFPLDVSGGVSRFRNRRGRLQRLAVELTASALQSWLAPKLRGVLGTSAPSVWLSVRAAGATVGIFETTDTRSPPRVLAFEVAIEAHDDDLWLWVHAARGAGLTAPSTALAMRVLSAALGKLSSRQGSGFLVRGASRALARALLPEAGARAPDAEGMRWTALGAHDDTWLLFADDSGIAADVTVEAARAREGARIAGASDDALFANDADGARTLAVAALERAPRHRELCRRIAEIDRVAGGRAEAALATMVEAEREARHRDGLLLAELLLEVGDTDAAVASLARVGETEAVGPLAACAFERAADLTRDPHDALVWLDMAIARAPALARLRESRLIRRLAAGRVEDALADAEHLEAQASGAKARHAVWRFAGQAWQNAGREAEAAPLYERALRFDPEDPDAFAGLGRALVASDRAARGTALLAQAVILAEATGEPAPHIVLALAIALADAMDDRPAAIERVRSIASDSSEALRARGLEGRWRAELGDLAGASFAFARMRELADILIDAPPNAARSPAVDLLIEAADYEANRRDDLLAAQRHLACALRLAPHDEAAEEAYRDIGQRIVGHPPPSRAWARSKLEERSLPDVPPATTSSLDLGLPLDDPPKETQVPALFDEAEDAARVEELTRTFHANPADDRVVDELSDRLLRLGRSHDLLALLSARLEDAPPERRRALVPKQREILARLEREARDAGRGIEAALFKDALAMLEP